MKKPISIIIIFALTFCVALAQKVKPKEQSPMSDSLSNLAFKMYTSKNNMMRYEANDIFLNTLKGDLKNEKAIDFAYDSVKSMSVLMPQDKKFKIFTWAFPLTSGIYEINGLVLVFSEKSKKYKYIDLKNISENIEKPEKEILKKGQWFPAIYYQLIENKINGTKTYTLIGWNGSNDLWQQKIIEILTFDRDNEPVFGKVMFRGKGYTTNKRIIFRYSQGVFMVLRYEDAMYSDIKVKEKTRYNNKINQNNNKALKKPKKKKIISQKSEKMIVFDQLIPIRPELEGQYQFYYPSPLKGNGFYFKDGKWIQKQLDVAVDTIAVKPLKYGLFPE